jgi:hypothetical protein
VCTLPNSAADAPLVVSMMSFGVSRTNGEPARSERFDMSIWRDRRA